MSSGYHPFLPQEERFLDFLKLISSSLSAAGSVTLLVFALILPYYRRKQQQRGINVNNNDGQVRNIILLKKIMRQDRFIRKIITATNKNNNSKERSSLELLFLFVAVMIFLVF
jgi:hypothetical protein